MRIGLIDKSSIVVVRPYKERNYKHRLTSETPEVSLFVNLPLCNECKMNPEVYFKAFGVEVVKEKKIIPVKEGKPKEKKKEVDKEIVKEEIVKEEIVKEEIVKEEIVKEEKKKEVKPKKLKRKKKSEGVSIDSNILDQF